MREGKDSCRNHAHKIPLDSNHMTHLLPSFQRPISYTTPLNPLHLPSLSLFCVILKHIRFISCLLNLYYNNHYHRLQNNHTKWNKLNTGFCVFRCNRKIPLFEDTLNVQEGLVRKLSPVQIQEAQRYEVVDWNMGDFIGKTYSQGAINLIFLYMWRNWTVCDD